MKDLLQEIRNCKTCIDCLAPNPVISANPKSKIIIIGQAPGRIVHETGIPWNDKSGDNLRKWMGIDKEIFYDDETIALIPMGFCYPGKGKSGDLPPRKECAPKWHQSFIKKCKEVQLTLLVGKYAQNYYLDSNSKKNLTETVKSFQEYLPNYIPLPHPSPRNNIWLAKNAWFAEIVLPALQEKVRSII